MSELTIEVSQREELGKNHSRRLRGAGKVPAVVYGSNLESAAITVDRRKVIELLHEGTGENTVFLLKMAGGDRKRHAMIKDMQVDARTREILHIDFQRVNMDVAVRIQVPVELEGTPNGVKNEGGVLDFITRELEVECLPGDIPTHLGVDVAELEIGDHVEASQVELPKGVTLLSPEDTVLASVDHARVAEVDEEGEEGEALLEADAPQPELIGKSEED